ncbi:MAG: hypothetical protein GF344_16095 [Chitinivibrionales bacterium]|nr:hypothetical protein [Chitinivibrionales bacterium]MBD3358217.1 hypothetical protein [Chitinivibrionales bacterium]
MKDDFEPKRKALLERLARMKGTKSGHRTATSGSRKTSRATAPSPNTCSLSPKRCENIVLFGAPSLFLKNLASSLLGITNVTCCDDVDKMVQACLNCSPPIVILDIDEPTDWRGTTDVFTALSMELPETKILICAKDPFAPHPANLESRGAILLSKPVYTKDIVACF